MSTSVAQENERRHSRSGSSVKDDGRSEKSEKEVFAVPDATVTVLPEGAFDPVYAAKAKLLNEAIQEIGMGKYQWHLFIVTGFGISLQKLFSSVG